MMIVKPKDRVKVTLDPGLNGTGYAIWSSSWKLLDHGIYSGSKNYDWYHRGRFISSQVHKLVCEHNRTTQVYMEFPAYFDSTGGNMVAKKGDLVKLTWFVGMVCGILYPKDINLIQVRDWKGQLPKTVVENRVDRYLKKVQYPKAHLVKSHAYDAIGIGLYAKEVKL